MRASDYAGEVSAAEAFDRLSGGTAVLLDVRTRPEWQFVGVPDLRGLGKQTLFLSWQDYPDMTVRGDFAEAVRAAGIADDQEIFVICRSGARSRAAAVALAAAGFTAWNVSDGFEGPLDADGHRGRDSGWKAAGLPWVQQ